MQDGYGPAGSIQRQRMKMRIGCCERSQGRPCSLLAAVSRATPFRYKSASLVTASGVGPALATALIASVADPRIFRSGRDFSAWVGLVPKQRSSGGKDKLGSISKQGDRYLRSLFTAGALAVIRYAKIHGTKHRPWLTALLARRPTKVASPEREGVPNGG